MGPDQIRFIMITFELSERGLAKTLNVAPYTVSRWMKGESSPTGLQLEVLQGLHSAAQEVRAKSDEKRQNAIAALVGLGIAALLFLALTKGE